MRANILVVDDSKTMRTVLRDTIATMGHTVFTAGDGLEALQVLRANDVDLMTCDVTMPQMGGLQVLRICKQMRPEMPVLMITATNALSTALEAVRLGAYDYVVKPFDGDQLRLSIARGLEAVEIRRRHQKVIDSLKNRLEERDAIIGERVAELKRLRRVLRRDFIDGIGVSINVLERYDGDMALHARRVADFAVRVGAKLGLTQEDLVNLEAAALLHDVGLMAMSKSLCDRVHRGEPLAADELDAYRQHPVLGMSIVEGESRLKPVRLMIRSHHEHFDGTGYPDRLAGEAIPVGARILFAVEDYCTALEADRPAWPDAPSDWLRARAGSHYDPAVVDAFVEVLGEFQGEPAATDTEVAEVLLDELSAGMKLAADVRTSKGALLVPRGQVLTLEIIARLQQLLGVDVGFCGVVRVAA